MNKFILSLVLLLTVACNSKDYLTKEIQGLWCGESKNCVYFQGSKCILYHAKIQEFQFLSETEIVITSEPNPIHYGIRINKEEIRLLKDQDKRFFLFHKPEKKNNKKIEEFYYSQNSEFAKYEMYLNKDGRGVLEIAYLGEFAPGKYVAAAPKIVFDFINELVNQMELEIPSKLNSGITSDIQEWGMKIITDQTHYLYYNYEGVNEHHQRLTFLMDMLPHILDLKEAASEISLDEIRDFRNNEFERNLKENDL